MAAHYASRRFAACAAGASLAALPWQRREEQWRPWLYCEVRHAPLQSLQGLLHLRQEAFVTGREALDVHSVYNFKDTIGEGGFGKVVRATHRRTGVQRAIKVIPKRGSRSEALNEIRALSELGDHPHIVKLIEYFEDSKRFYLVQALCDGPDLAELLADAVNGVREQRLTEREVSIVIRDCIRSVIGCHARGFIHRDLKLDNFMVADKSDGVVKVIDFGLAARSPERSELTEVTGTVFYRAPEMMVPRWRRAKSADVGGQPGGYDKSVDVWSLGVVLFALLAGEPLFKHSLSAREVQDKLADPKYVRDRVRYCPALRDCGQDARDLLTRMLDRDPRLRITTSEALKHPFVLRHSHETLNREELQERAARQERLRLAADTAALDAKVSAFAGAPRLRQIALLALTHVASEETDPTGELRALRQVFCDLDHDGDGRIALGEGGKELNFAEFLACSLPQSLIDEELCSEVFLMMDRDFDGAVDARDLLPLAGNCEKECEEIIREAEERLRGPGSPCSGRLTMEDFQLFLRGSGAK